MNSKNINHKVAGIVIAAGESKRLGKTKLLLQWRGKFLIEFIIQIAHECGLDPLQVVLGSNYDQIASVINFSHVNNIINNQNWKEGKGTSISSGIGSLPKHVEAAFIFVVDQPFLNKNLINVIMDIYKKKHPDIVAPYVQGIQSNPVLFDRSVFPDLIKFIGNEGGRDIFNKYRLEKIDWADEKILWDVDTSTDFEKMINQE